MRTELRRVAVPIALFVVSELALFAVAKLLGFDPLRASTWVRWDAEHYLDIARRGYEIHQCAGGEDYARQGICGNAVWMPMYPLAMRLVGSLGIPLAAAGWAISASCRLLTLLWLWNRELADSPRTALRCLWLAALFPGGVYYDAVFPIAPFVLCAFLALDALADGKGLRAGLFALLASTIYSTGFVFAAAALAFGLTNRSRLRPAVVAAGGASLGLPLVMAWHQYALHDWRAMFELQSHFGHTWHSPLATLAVALRPLVVPTVPGLLAIALLTAWMTIAVGAAVLAPGKSQRDWLFVWFGAAFWGFSLTFSMVEYPQLYRAGALLLPLVVPLRRLPPVAVAALAASGALIALLIADCYFVGSIV
jgi:hypothetical protein